MLSHFSVVFTGSLLEGFNLEQVKSALSDKLNLSDHRIDNLISSPPRIIKKYENQIEAIKLVSAFRSCGAICYVQIVDSKPMDSKMGAIQSQTAMTPDYTNN